LFTDRIIHVLVAEDEQLFLNSLIKKIEKCDPSFKVVASAHNGRMAMKLINEVKPDILFTDIKMPIMDGITLIENVRIDFPDMPIIILSGYNEFEYARKALQAGVTDYLLKPVNDGILLEILQKVKEKVFLKYSVMEKKIITSQLNGTGADIEFLQSFNKSFFAIFLVSAGNLGTSLTSISQIKIFTQIWEHISWDKIINAITLPIHDWLVVDEKYQNQKFLILVLRENQMYDLKTTASELYQNLKYFFAPYALNICGVSNSVACKDIWQIAHKLRNSLDKCLVIGQSNIYIDFEDKLEYIDTLIYPELRLKLSSLVSSGKYDLLTNTLKDIFKSWQAKQYPQHIIEKAFCDLIELIQLHIPRTNSSDKKFYDFNYQITECISMTPDYESICNHILNMISQMLKMQLLEYDQPAQHADFIEKYLREHFTEDISLEEIAVNLSFSSAYLSKVFKKYKNSTPLKYLTSLRIEETKRLIIEHSDLDFKVIAEMVGFFDCHYFYKVFKNTVGQTPTEFKTENGLKQSESKHS
jgi:two-component system response regulator YesN